MREARPSLILPAWANAALVLADGTVFWGRGVGATGVAVGEVCFNTSMTGYQEILTDPSYAGQIITFTFPHIGNVGSNSHDAEAVRPAALGCVLRAAITPESNWRAETDLNEWLVRNNLIGMSGVDTRRLTRRIRKLGSPAGTLCHVANSGASIDVEDLRRRANDWPGLTGMDLAVAVTRAETTTWSQTTWSGSSYGALTAPKHHIVAVDFGAKHNILRNLSALGCQVTVVPATVTAAEILSHKPEGVFLSNGPGDPAATGKYAVPTLRTLVQERIPIFGICLGHQILALALGAQTEKMHHGHRGANHPVNNHETGHVEITSQNHGFVVRADTLPEGVRATHTSLFDGSLEGIALQDKPVFSVQYHPEASPGPHDSHYLFKKFVGLIENAA